MKIQRELLHKYFRGETVPDEEKQIMDWAEASPENYCLYLEERKKWNALLIHYHSASRQTQTAQSKKHSFTTWKTVSIAASIALLFALSWIVTQTEKETAGLQAVVVPAGQRVELQLEDGTRVWLNSNSSFTYPTSFGKRNREVVLDGEGYFEVASNEKKPFIVKTHKYDIKVLGTAFNVYAYQKENGAFETSLIRGSVEVSSPTASDHPVILQPNEMVCEVNGALRKTTIDHTDRFRWKDGLICVDDIPFEALMEKFSVYYDIHIKIENESVLDYRPTAKFRQSDGIEYALRVLQRDCRFNYTRDDETNTIIIR